MDEQSRKKDNSVPWDVLFFFFSLMILSCIASFVLSVFCDFFWERWPIPSPTGEYRLEQRILDVGGWGYRCRTYLYADGKCYKISKGGIGTAHWLDDETFAVSGSAFGDWEGGIYTVSEITSGIRSEEHQKGADSDAGP